MPAAAPQPFPSSWEYDVAYMLPDQLWNTEGLKTSPIFKHFPLSYVDAYEVLWPQYDNAGGLIPTRANGGAPDFVKLPGFRVDKAQPGFYGLETRLEETEMTVSAQPDEPEGNRPLDVRDRLGKIVLDTSVLAKNRLFQTLGTFAATGTFANYDSSGAVAHTYTAAGFKSLAPAGDGNTGPSWAAQPGSATPIKDLIYWQTTVLQPGTSASFGPDSFLLCNPKTVNTFWNTSFVQNTFRNKYGGNFSRGDNQVDGELPRDDQTIYQILTGAGLPPFTVVRDGYYPTLAAAVAQDASQWKYAIPDNYIVWVGRRPSDAPIAACKLTRHGGIGAYQADRFPTVDLPDEQMLSLAQGFFVRAKYEDMMPVHYRLQVGFNMAPFIPYIRGIAGIYVG